MSSYLSSILTTTTTRYASLRRTLLSDETDGDTEDDTHISRVLRAYYIEKNRPFPPWLPPDPKAPQKAPTPIEPQFSNAQSSRLYGAQSSQQMGGGSGRGRGLSDLWDAPQQGGGQEENLSLRRGGAGRGVQQRLGGVGRGGIGEAYDRGGAGGGGLQPQQPVGRPLPSQRVGSYQSQFAQQQAASPPQSSGSASGSAQERLKARLMGGGKSGAAVERSNPLSSPGLAQAGQRNPYDRGNSYNDPGYGGGASGAAYGGGGGGDYSGGGGYNDASRRGLPGRPPNGPRSR